jgi:hypothetical protein
VEAFMRRNLFFGMFCLLFVISCSIVPRQPVSFPTSTPFRLPPTWTPKPTQTDSLKATEAVWPTFTAVPPITLNANFSNTPQSKWANYIPLVAPNGDWTAYYNLNEIRIVKGEDSIWTLPCTLFERCIYIMATQWSMDSKYLYFGASDYMGGISGGDDIPLFSTAGRINVRTGKWERLFRDPNFYFDFAVSPDGDYVAFVEPIFSDQGDNREVLLHVMDFGTRQTKDYSADGSEGGNIVWSPYKPRFVFVTRDPYKGSYIVYFDVTSEVMRYVYREGTDILSIDSWLENNLVLIHKTKQSGKTPSPLYINPFTGESVPISPTPTP